MFAGTAGALLGLSKSFSTSFWMYVALEGLEAAVGDALSPMFMLSKLALCRYTHHLGQMVTTIQLANLSKK